MYHFILEPWKENHNLCSQQTLKLTKMTKYGSLKEAQQRVCENNGQNADRKY